MESAPVSSSSLAPSYFGVVLPLVAIILLILNVFKKDHKGKKFPPGPGFTLPIIGNLHQLGTKPHLTFQKWRKRYGPLFYFKMGNEHTVVVSDAKLMKELLATPASCGKPNTAFFNVLGNGGYGLIASSGKNWEEQRPFAIRTLKDLGLSTRGILEGIIMDDAKSLVKYFESRAGRPMAPKRVFNGAVISSLWGIVSGERTEWLVDGKVEETEITRAAGDLLEHVNNAANNGLAFISWLRHVAPELLGWNKYVKSISRFMDMAESAVSRHLDSLDPNSATDFIDHHLLRGEATTDPNSSFYKEHGRNNLKCVVADFILAGSETTATTMEFALLYLSQHPEVQSKLHDELDSVLGSRLPSLSDRPGLPYAEAVVLETFRMAGTVSMTPRRILEDFEFHGYFLPKDAILLGDVYNTLRDPANWGSDSDIFKPERFLLPPNNGESKKVAHHEAFMPFGAGKRLCIGESLAKDTVFLFVTCLLQKFVVEASPAGKQLDYNDVDAGFVLEPKHFEILVTARK